MPELIEVEMFRAAAEAVVGRTVSRVDAPDSWFLKHGLSADVLGAAVLGAEVLAATRRGKLLMMPMSSGAVLGLRFGMTGRLAVDGRMPIERLEFSSRRVDPAWVRFELEFVEGGCLSIIDPRRLGGVELDPDVSTLGPDASTVTVDELRSALGRSAAPLREVAAWIVRSLASSHSARSGRASVTVISTWVASGLFACTSASADFSASTRGLASLTRVRVLMERSRLSVMVA